MNKIFMRTRSVAYLLTYSLTYSLTAAQHVTELSRKEAFFFRLTMCPKSHLQHVNASFISHLHVKKKEDEISPTLDFSLVVVVFYCFVSKLLCFHFVCFLFANGISHRLTRRGGILMSPLQANDRITLEKKKHLEMRSL